MALSVKEVTQETMEDVYSEIRDQRKVDDGIIDIPVWMDVSFIESQNTEAE